MEWKKLLGFLSLLLLVFAFVVGVQTESGYCLGDNILRSIGLKAWSLESAQQLAHGFHYTFFLFLGLAILGYLGTKRFLSDYPHIVKRLPAIVIVLFFLATPLFKWGYGMALSFSNGVNAVDYLPAQSNCNFARNPETGLIAYNYDIKLRNYSTETVTFNMQVQLPLRDGSVMAGVTETDVSGKEVLKEFILQPREKRDYTFVLENKNDRYRSVAGSGSMHRPNITIFDKDSSREFNVN